MRLKPVDPRDRHHVKELASVWCSLERLWDDLGADGADGAAVSGQTDGRMSGAAVGFAVQATKFRQKSRRRLEKRLESTSKLLKIQANI